MKQRNFRLPFHGKEYIKTYMEGQKKQDFEKLANHMTVPDPKKVKQRDYHGLIEKSIEKLNDSTRTTIFNNFWAIRDHEGQRNFITWVRICQI